MLKTRRHHRDAVPGRRARGPPRCWIPILLRRPSAACWRRALWFLTPPWQHPRLLSPGEGFPCFVCGSPVRGVLLSFCTINFDLTAALLLGGVQLHQTKAALVPWALMMSFQKRSWYTFDASDLNNHCSAALRRRQLCCASLPTLYDLNISVMVTALCAFWPPFTSLGLRV